MNEIRDLMRQALMQEKAAGRFPTLWVMSYGAHARLRGEAEADALGPIDVNSPGPDTAFGLPIHVEMLPGGADFELR